MPVFPVRKSICWRLGRKERENQIIKTNSGELVKWLRCKPHMEHVSKEASSVAVSEFISLAVLLLLLLLLCLLFFCHCSHLNVGFVFGGVDFRKTESITLADRNNQIQFKSKVHTLGSFMPSQLCSHHLPNRVGGFFFSSACFCRIPLLSC